MERLIALFLITLIFISCEKKELPVPKYNRGAIITQQISMSSNYKYQIWYRLSDNSIVASNAKTDWDIAFEASASGMYILLNSSKSMKAYKTNFVSLTQVTDTSGVENGGKADVPSGNLDSTGIGDWQTNNTVYTINRGYNENAQHQGYYKLKINSVSATTYQIEFGDIYGSQTYSATINKNGLYNFSYFSFSTGNQVDIEPKKTDYDLCFTQYTHIFHNPFQYYLVAGTLQNSYNTRVAYVFDKPFNNITITDTLGRTFFTNKNTIGYEWKSYDINTGIYTVDLTKCYIIQDSKGLFYKFHFIDFYDISGTKGYPKFELKKL